MLRKDREVTDFNEIYNIISRCGVCRIALNDGDFPYIIPLNFCICKNDENKITLYFHGALSGKKYELISKNPKGAFEADRCEEYEPGSLTSRYESAAGTGILSVVTDKEEKAFALKILAERYEKKPYSVTEKMIAATNVFKMEVIAVTGKRNLSDKKQ